MRRRWKTIALVSVIAAVALSVVAVAYGSTRTTTRRAAGTGACGALMTNPKALNAMQTLRAEHQRDMQAWSAQYGSDPSTLEAQAALKSLRVEHWNDMRDLFRNLGIQAPSGSGFGGGMMRGAGGCDGACGGAGASGTGSQGTGYGGGGMGGSATRY